MACTARRRAAASRVVIDGATSLCHVSDTSVRRERAEARQIERLTASRRGVDIVGVTGSIPVAPTIPSQRAIAEAFAAEGATTIIAARNPARLAAALDDIARATGIMLDIDGGQVQAI